MVHLCAGNQAWIWRRVYLKSNPPLISISFVPADQKFSGNAAGEHRATCRVAMRCSRATGAKHCLHRDLTGRFGSAKYAMDEVIVELTDSFVMANLGTRP